MEIFRGFPIFLILFFKKVLKIGFNLKERLSFYSFRYFSYLALSGLILSISIFSNLGAKIGSSSDIFENNKSLLVSLISLKEEKKNIEIVLDSENRSLFKGLINGQKIGGVSQETEEGEEILLNFSNQDHYLYSFKNPIYISPRKEIDSYIVKKDDTISQIAQVYQVSAGTILWANKLTEESIIKPGDVLKIPPITGAIHRIKKNETIESIAKEYKVDKEKILAYNEIENLDDLKIDQELIIPEAKIVIPKKKETIKQIRPEKPSYLASNLVSDKKGFIWPTSSRRINQYYKWHHQAIDIDGNLSSGIFSSEEGTVEYAGWKRGYGNVVFINHGNGFRTIYAHASQVYVKNGQKVSKGQKIGMVGSTGWSTGPHLHFEIEKNNKKINPLSAF